MAGNDTLRFYYPWPAYGVKMSRQWPHARENFDNLAPLVRAAYVDLQPASAHNAGENDLSGWALGERDFRNRFRTWYDKVNNMFKIQYNSGTEAAPVWSDAIQIRESDLRVIIAGSGGIQSSVGGFYSGTPVPDVAALHQDFTLSGEWVFNHNFDAKPILWNTFRSNGVAIVPSKVDVSDRNIAYFYFNTPVAGTAIATSEGAGSVGVTFTDGTNTWLNKTRLNFNHSDFYLTPSSSGNAPVVNYRGSGGGVTAHSALTGLTADDHTQYSLADGTRAFTGVVAGITPVGSTDLATKGYVDTGDATTLASAIAADGPGFYGVITKLSDNSVVTKGDTLIFDSADFTKSTNTVSVKDSGIDHGGLGGLADDDHTQYSRADGTRDFSGVVVGVTPTSATHLATKGYVDSNQSPGFYGVITKLSDNSVVTKGDTIIFDIADFSKVANTVSIADSGIDHGGLGGLSDDDHASYLLASDATSRAAFATNWLDLTDGGATTLHSHTAATPDPGFYGVNFRETDGGPDFRNDTIYFDSSDFYLSPNSIGKPVLSFRGATGGGGVTDHGALTGLGDDDHVIYTLADGSRDFSGVVIGVDPTTAQHLATKGYVDAAVSPGFYGIYIRESDGTPPTFRNDTLTFDSTFFYLTGSGAGNKPLVSIRLAGINSDNSIPLSALSDELKDLTTDLIMGSTLHSTTTSVTSNGSTVTLTWTDTGGEGLAILLDETVYQIAPLGGSISTTLTAGTDDSPTVNYCYLLESAPTVITVSTSDWPANTVSHAKVARVICQSASSVQTYGPYLHHGWTDHVMSGTEAAPGNGHLLHLSHWMRTQPATWISGIATTPTVNTGPTPDTVTFATTAGVVRQLHAQNYPAFADSSSFFVYNHNTAAYTVATTMPGQTSSGVAIGNNDRINVVLWGAVNATTGDCKLFMNLPTAYYTNTASAAADSNKYTVFTLPAAYTGVRFLISWHTFKYTTAGGGTYTLEASYDLRGTFPAIAAGGSLSASTEFADSTFRINDNTDPTKELAFEVSDVTTATTRTLTIPDRDGTIALTDQLSGDFYHLVVRESDGNPPPYKTKSLIFDSADFYLNSTAAGRPMVSLRGAASGGTALTVKDIDGTPTVSNVSTLQFTNGSVTDNGGGVAEITISAGGGISTLTEGSKSFGSQTVMGVNANHFYLSPGGSAGNKVLNLRYSKDIIPVFQELVSVSNFAVDPFAPYPYIIEQVEVDCKSGSCIAAFYIISAAARNSNGISVLGLDPINVSTTATGALATGANTVNKGDCLLLSIPSNTTAKHLRIAITAKKPD